MTTTELHDGVLRRIDEAVSEQIEGIDHRYPVAVFLREATREMLRTAPLHTLPKTDFSAAKIVALGDGTGTVVLPANFLRIASFRLRGWHRPVTALIAAEDPLYARQLNPITRGGVAKPVAALWRDAEGLKLRWFSLPPNLSPQIVEALCIVDTEPTDLPELLTDPLCWLAASLVLMTTNESAAAEMARQRYEFLLQQL